MGSDRAYDVSGIVGAAPPLPVLGREERGTKVRHRSPFFFFFSSR